MRKFLIIARELKDWLEYFIRNTPGRIGYLLRANYYKSRLKKSFQQIRFESGLRIEFPRNIEIGSNSYLGLDCKIYASESSQISIGSNVSFNSNVMINARGKGKISIGNNVLIGPNVVLRSSNHSFEISGKPIIEQGMIDGEITVNDDVWIGSNAVILPNCNIGRGVIIGAGAVVTCDIEPNSIVGGVPAKLIRKRDLKL